VNGITPDKLAALLLCYDTPRGNVAVKGMKSITSNYMLPPVEVDQLSRSSGGARGPKPTDSEVSDNDNDWSRAFISAEKYR
jgi:hypothetical protein